MSGKKKNYKEKKKKKGNLKKKKVFKVDDIGVSKILV